MISQKNITSRDEGLEIAIIGAGAAGLAAAHLLQKKHSVTIFEKNSFIGGHAHTIIVEHGADKGTALDIGFMVLNDKNYPTLHKLLAQLGQIKISNSDMSFSYHSEKDNLQYAYANPKSHMSSQTVEWKKQKPDATILKLIKEIVRFGSQAAQDLKDNNLDCLTLGEYLHKRKASESLIQFYIVPTASAIWSTSPQRILDFPAKTFLHFMDNHGMLTRKDVPQWQYIKGGSQIYVQAILKNFTGIVKVNSNIEYIARPADRILIKTQDQVENFDYVVIATHADEALNILADPSTEECELLGAWEYQTNNAILHTDESVMPTDRAAWASWNFTQESEIDDPSLFSVTYFLNRLQGHKNTEKEYFLTLNRQKQIPSEHILYKIKFTHPIYTFKSINTQKKLFSLNGNRRTYFCGSYFGYGFHEDAIKSGIQIAQKFGIEL